IQGIGIYHACVMIFRRKDLDGADFVIGPHRGPQWPAFSRPEIATMEMIHPHIDAAYRRVNQLQSQHCARRGMEELIALLPLPAILIDWNVVPLFHNSAALDATVRWLGGDAHLKRSSIDFALPLDLLAAVAQMKDDWT